MKKPRAMPPTNGPADLIRAFTNDDLAFDRMVEHALGTGNEALLKETVLRASPNQVASLERDIWGVVENMDVGDQVARLLLLPVIVHPRDGVSPNNRIIIEALFASKALPPKACDVYLGSNYYLFEDLAVLGFAGHRAVLASLLSEDLACPLPKAELSTSGCDGRGTLAVIVGAIVCSDTLGKVPFIDQPFEFAEHRELFEKILASGGGIVDVSYPVGNVSLLDPSPEGWFVANSDSVGEIRKFFDVAAAAVRAEKLACELRPLVGARSGMVSMTLMSDRKEVVDARDFAPASLPISMGELLRTARTLSSEFKTLPALPPLVMGVPHPRPPRSAPKLRVELGGRLQREAEDRDAWGAGMARNMAALKAGSTITE
jgi:hypothetical protein